jgi:hypothetical protein
MMVDYEILPVLSGGTFTETVLTDYVFIYKNSQNNLLWNWTLAVEVDNNLWAMSYNMDGFVVLSSENGQSAE